MPFLVDGKPKENAFAEIEIPKGNFAIFKRKNFKGFQVQTSKGIVERNVPSCGVIVEFVTLKNPLAKSNNLEQCLVRYYTNSTSSQGANGQINTTYFPDAVDFHGEVLKVPLKTAEGQELYRMLKINPMNVEIGKRIGKEMPISYEEFDPLAVAKAANELTASKNRAIAMVYNEDKVPNDLAINLHKHILQGEAQVFATGTAELLETDNMQQIRLDLSTYATNHPTKFEKLVANANLGLRAKIKECESFGIIEFSSIESQWMWNTTQRVRKNKVITTVPAGEDEMQELLAFLTSNSLGKRVLEDIDNELESAKKVTA